MRYETLAILLIILCAIILGLEFLWLYILAEKQEAFKTRYDKAYTKIMELFHTILHAPTEVSMQEEIGALKAYAGQDRIKLDILCNRLLKLILQDDLTDMGRKAVLLIHDTFQPVAIYRSLLKKGNVYEKAYSCRKIADFFGEEEIPVIRKMLDSKNQDLSYNAAMALAALGDEESVVAYILRCEQNFQYSYRVIMELLETYPGDMVSLAKKVLAVGGDYIKATVIKGIAKYQLEEFQPLFIEGMSSSNINIKISCVKALGEFGKQEHEHRLIIALHDKNWVVRTAAIKGLQKLDTQASILAVRDAIKDPEWWVRYNAARALVQMDKNLDYIESVLDGYDKYAADAVKYLLYKTVNLNLGGITG